MSRSKASRKKTSRNGCLSTTTVCLIGIIERWPAADEESLESNSSLFAPVVLAHLKTLETLHDVEARRISLVRMIKGLYTRGLTAEQIRNLYRVIESMMSLPEPLTKLAWKEIRDFVKEKNMAYITGAELVGREEGLAEGLAKGREEGRQEGRQEGLAIGARQSLIAGIKVALELKFAAPDEALLHEIRQIEDVGLLERILGAVTQAESPAALRRLWR